MQYEYEMFFDDNSPISIHGWYPIATDRIKDQSRIQEYIDKGILRRIDMKEQDAAHSFEGMDVPKKESIIQFLLGANSYDGYWWNESPQVYGRAPFWWRKKLREEFESKEAELTRLRSELQTLQSALDHCKEVGSIRQDLIAEQKSELQQKDEVIKEIYKWLQLAYGELIQVSSNPVLLEYKKSVINKIESLIKKAKLNN